MKGLIFAGDRQIDYVEVEDPTPGLGEVVLEMKASGICGSDLHMYRGPKGMRLLGATATGPIIAGHEPCGVVVAVGPGVTDRQAKIGDRAMVHHYWGCGTCPHCRTGWAQMCDQQQPTIYGIGAHGGHAQYLKVPEGTLVALPESLSFAAGAAISCGTGTSYAALRRFGVSGGDVIAIFGQGPVGLAATQLAAAMGARVIAIDPSAERLAFAKELGATDTIDPNSGDTVAAIQALTHGKGADYAFEASGAGAARTAGVKAVRPWGSVAFVGVGGEPTVEVGAIMRRQITVFGSWTFSNVGQGECARFIADRNIAADRIFTDRWRLDQGVEAYQKVDGQKGGKGVFIFGDRALATRHHPLAA
jgi:threonine dehydrogenase-like Zn-dependent dehydrogenase